MCVVQDFVQWNLFALPAAYDFNVKLGVRGFELKWCRIVSTDRVGDCHVPYFKMDGGRKIGNAED